MNIKAEKLIKFAHLMNIRILIEVCITGKLYIYTDKDTSQTILNEIKDLEIKDDISFRLTTSQYNYQYPQSISYLEHKKEDTVYRFKGVVNG